MRLRASLAGLALALGALPHALAIPPACAGAGPRAALVIDDGRRVQRLCVTLDAAEVSGIHLIELAGDQHGLSYSFGYGGQAVCMLGGTGPEGPDCFSERPDFWGLWQGRAVGTWSWSAEGAGSIVVEDGDVEGWSWGAGTGGADHPPPPATRFEDVCASAAAAPAPPPSPVPSASPPPKPSPQPPPSASPRPEVQAKPSPAPSGRRPRRHVTRRAPRSARRPAPVPSPGRRRPEPPPAPRSGPPAAGVAGLGGALIVAGLGLWRGRRRSGGPE